MIPAGAETSAMFNLAWWLLAIETVFAAILVIRLRDIFKAALALVAFFLGVVGLFVLLNAEFLAAVQLLIYVGAISILLVFTILLTRDVQGGNTSSRFRGLAMVPVLFLVSVVIFVATTTDWPLLQEAALLPPVQEKVAEVFGNSAPWIGGLLVREFVLPFEAVSLLLVAALVGAIALAREP